MTSTDESILLSVEGGLARVTLNRPASLNAMNFEMADRWLEVATAVTQDPNVGAVILDAAGPAFCAGGDVIAMSSSGADGAEITEMARVIHRGIITLALSDKPVVAAVQGVVAGGGLGLMLTADYIVAADAATFVSRYANIGLTPDLGVSTLLPAAIGQRRALQLLLADTMIDAPTALDWGLVTEVVAAADVPARVDEVARYWLDNSTAAFGQAKQLVRLGAQRDFQTNLDAEAESIGARFDTPDARARVGAFAAAAAARAAAKKEAR